MGRIYLATQTESIKDNEFDFKGFPNINKAIRKGINNYTFHNIKPGGFLRACLESDARAILYADDENSEGTVFRQIILFLCNRMPFELWGNPEKVREHLAKKEIDNGLLGR
jgi:hypothetical protein